MRTHRNAKRAGLLATAAIAGLATSVLAGTSGNAVTVSLSGSTAIRNFTISAGFTLLNPGSSITLNSGPGGTPVTYAATGTASGVQLAATDFTSGITANPNLGDPPVSSANYAALRVEWHEQGAVEGIYELTDSQIDDNLMNNLIYNPTTGNATYINRNKFGGSAPSGPNPPATLGGHFLDLHPNSLTARNVNGQNRVQMSISDMTAAQGLSRAGTGAYSFVPGQAGYGKGNPALTAAGNVTGTGVAGARQQLQDEVALNMSTSTVDPSTGSNYNAGPWNNAGVSNLHNETVAISATTLSANPGTGLARLNRGNAQWLQSTGRLANGADFNVTTRDVGSGTRNVASLNVGLDPSFSSGENDDGSGQASEANIGPGIKFSGKTSGGSLLRPTIQNSRMAIGHLSLPDAQAAAQTGVSRPIRALDYRDDDNDVNDNSNSTYGYTDPASGTFVHISAANLVNGSYVIYQNQTYVTVKAPNPAFAADTANQWAARTDAETGIKGDNAGTDVADFRGNVLGSVATFPAGSVASPADAMIQNSLILPQFMQVKKIRDGVNQSVANPGYNATLSNAFLGSPSLTIKFDVASANSITKGSGSSYGNISNGSAGYIVITDQNYLFGNFRQNGMRDFAAIKAAQGAQAALGSDNDMFTGATANTTKIAGLAAPLAGMTGSDGTAGATKGDLIVLGDMNSDGKFNGNDLYLMAHGAALADNTSTDELTATSGADLGDRLRNGVLRKNAALDYMNGVATAQQKIDARASATNDATGILAFDKTDVNRDGIRDFKDAKLVDYYAGKDYRKLDDQLGATMGADGDSPRYTQSPVRLPISLVDVELNDTGTITTHDFGVIRPLLTALLDGDSDFNGRIDGTDYAHIDSAFNQQTNQGWINSWGNGDFDSNDRVDGADYALIDAAFNSQPGVARGSLARAMDFVAGFNRDRSDMTTPELMKVLQHFDEFGDAYVGAMLAVPEPSTAAFVGLGAAVMTAFRRRRRGCRLRSGA